VAILIVSFGVLGLVGLQARATQFSVGAEDRNRAASLADDIGAQMLMSNSAGLSSAQLERYRERAASALPNAQLTVQTANRVSRITLSWRQPGAPDTAASSVYVTDVVVQP
jgi:type IV pilus assembly protein PilV